MSNYAKALLTVSKPPAPPPPALSLPNIAPNILRALPLQVNLLKIPDAKMNSSLGPDHRNPFK